jgi:hypothetical protein
MMLENAMPTLVSDAMRKLQRLPQMSSRFQIEHQIDEHASSPV